MKNPDFLSHVIEMSWHALKELLQHTRPVKKTGRLQLCNLECNSRNCCGFLGKDKDCQIAASASPKGFRKLSLGLTFNSRWKTSENNEESKEYTPED